ncbi:MAG: helix-turn-helix transcriptional regulator [Crocinitomicaceae bacterium]|nr:helix-turn-helix transcriptional regulator [Crocinitomicaceae bacterium]
MILDYQQFDFQGKMTFVRAVVKPPFRMSFEMHNEACFYFVKSGTQRVYAPTDNFDMNSDEGIVLQCGTYINDFIASKDAEYCEAIAIHLFPDMLKLVYDNEFPDFLTNLEQMTPALYERAQSTSLLENYIESLEFYFKNPELVSDELLKLKLKELILLLSKTSNADIIKTLLAGAYDPQQAEFKEVIEANLFNNMNSQELALLTNLSLSSFKRTFEKNYNEPPASYMRRRKLEQAAKLLKSTELRVSDVAFDCGFSDLANFSKSFQKMYDTSPSEYRK